MGNFKDYIVNYDLRVNIPEAGGLSAFESVIKSLNLEAKKAQIPLKNISGHLNFMHNSLKNIREKGGLNLAPTIDLTGFKAQVDSMVRMAAEGGRAAAEAFNAAMAGKGAKSPVKKAGSDIQGLRDQIARAEEERMKKYFRESRHRDGTTSMVRKRLTDGEKQQYQDDLKALNRLKQELERREKLEKETGRRLAAINKPTTPVISQVPTGGFDQKWIASQLKDGKSKTVKLTISAVNKAQEAISAIANGLNGLKELSTINIKTIVHPEAFAQAEGRLTSLLSLANQFKAAMMLPLSQNGNGNRGTRATNARTVNESINRLQSLANGRNVNVNTRAISNGQAGFDLNQHLMRLQQLASGRFVNLSTRVISTGQAGFDLQAHIRKLQQIASANPIKLNTTISPSAVGTKSGKGATSTNVISIGGIVENVALSKAVKVSGGPVKVEGVLENVKAAKGMKPIDIKANINAPGLETKVNSLRELSEIWKVLPKTGSRTYTVNLKMPGIENIGKLRELLSIVGSMPQSQQRSYNTSVRGGKANNGTSSARQQIIASGGRVDTRYSGRPRGTMNTFAYQLMGNTSLGARTPVFLDMMKGMGMMSGVGAAMSTLTNAFTNASEYQNTMVTARSILEANYQGGNFNADFGNMERIVRDVAKKTKFTAPQAADAARFMAMAGLNIPMINASIRPIADVAVIGDNDLGEVADKITNIQTAFGIQPNRMRALADALTKTFTSSNTDMMMLAESMEYAAPMAHLAGAQVEDALAMIGIMGNAGIQGSMAGTTLRMMYQNVINPNKKQQKMWDSLGISLKDASGNPRQLIDILGDLRQKVRISRDDKDEEGRFKDEGTPIAEAVSRLFRVTASAGAGTLLENLDKVIALADANRNATGLSQRISEVKQNDVKGMWARMTSAFTDAVVTEFESGQSNIKDYLKSLTDYFNSPDFKDMLKDIFDLVQSMMSMLGRFAKIWKAIYDIFGPIIKYTMMAQFFLAQIGYLMAPLRSVWMTGVRGIGVVKNMTGGTAMASAAGLAGAAMMGNGTVARYTSKAIAEAQMKAAKYDQFRNISKERYNKMSAAHAANVAMWNRQYGQAQWNWVRANRMNDMTLNRYMNNGRFWNMAYTNPEAAAAMAPINRKSAFMARKVAQMEDIERQIANSQAGVNRAKSQMERDAVRASLAHQRAIFIAANERHAQRMLSSNTLNRAIRSGAINRWQASGMMLRQGGRAISNTLGLTAIGGMLKSVGKSIWSALNLIPGPVKGIAVALGGIFALTNIRKRAEEARQKELDRLGESFARVFNLNDILLENRRNLAKGTTANDIFGFDVVTLNANVVNLNQNGEETLGLRGIVEDEKYSQLISDITDKSKDIGYKNWADKIVTEIGKIANNPEIYVNGGIGLSNISQLANQQHDIERRYWDASRVYFSRLQGDPRKRNLKTRDAEALYNRLGAEYTQSTQQLRDSVYVAGVRSMIAQRAFEMPEYLEGYEKLKRISEEYLSLPESAQKTRQQEYLGRIDELIENYNPEKNKNLLRITDRATAEKAIGLSADQLYDSYYQIYTWLKEQKEGIPVYSQMLGTMLSLKNVWNKGDDDYYKNLMRIIGNIEFKPSSSSQGMTIPLNKYGAFDMTALADEFARAGVNDYQATLVSAFRNFYNVLKTQDAYKNIFDRSITEEEFISGLWFAALHEKPINSQLGGQLSTPPSQYAYRNPWGGTTAFTPAKLQDINIHLHGNMFNVETMNAENFTVDEAKRRIMDVVLGAIGELNK